MADTTMNGPDRPHGSVTADRTDAPGPVHQKAPPLPLRSGPISGFAPGGPEGVPSVDGYQIISRIGEGGMGTVWRAWQLSARREVALKLLGAANIGSERAKRRFDREVELTARLQHPNIARLYDSGLLQGVYFYAMELIDGEPLDQFVRREGLGRGALLTLFRAVCLAVQYAHQRGIIHRDLKPSNILVDKEGQPHVLDFGLAKPFSPGDSGSDLSQAGDLAGTTAFMSPEQAAGRVDHLDTRSDVYSLGVILYRLLTGRSPHDLRGLPLAVLRRVAEDEIIPPRRAAPGLDRDLESLLLKALAKDPEGRYSSAGALAEDVSRYLRGDPLAARPPTAIYFLRKRLRKHRIMVGAAAACVILSAALVVNYVQWSLRVAAERVRNLETERDYNRQRARDAELARARDELTIGGQARAAGQWEAAERSYADADDRFRNNAVESPAAGLGILELRGLLRRPVTTIQIGPSPVRAAAFGADGRSVRVLDFEGAYTTWDLVRGRRLAQVEATAGRVQEATMSADGRVVAMAVTNRSGPGDAHLEIWGGDMPAGAAQNRPPPVPIILSGTLSVSPNGSHVLFPRGLDPPNDPADNSLDSPLGKSPDPPPRCVTWDVFRGRESPPWQGDCKGLLCLTFAGERLAISGHSPGELQVWDVQAARAVRRWNLGDVHCHSAALSPDGGTAAVGGDEFLTFWDVASGAPRRPAVRQGARTSCLAFSGDSRVMASGTVAGTVQLWDPSRGEVLCSLVGSKLEIRALVFSPDGRAVLAADEGGAVRVWPLADDPRANVERHAIRTRAAVGCCSLSGDGRLLLAGDSSDSTARLLDVATGNELRALAGGGREPVVAVHLSPEGRRALCGYADGSVDGWALDSGARLFSLGAKDLGRCRVVFAPDGRRMLRGGARGLWSWEIGDGGEAHELARLSGAGVRAFGFSPDGHSVGFADGDGRLTFVDADGTQMAPPPDPVAAPADGRMRRLCALAVIGEPRSALCGDSDGRLQLLRAGPGTNVGAEVAPGGFVGHAGAVACLAVLPGRRSAVSGGDDGTMRLWDLTTGRQLLELDAGPGKITAVGVSQDARVWAAAADGGRSLQVWDLSRLEGYRRLEEGPAGAGGGPDRGTRAPGGLVALAQWYALRGQRAWVVSALETAPAAPSNGPGAGRPPAAEDPALLLARTYWLLARNADAAAVFDRAAREGEAAEAAGGTPAVPVWYLKLCAEAARRPPAR